MSSSAETKAFTLCLLYSIICLAACAKENSIEFGSSWKVWGGSNSVHELANFKIELDRCAISFHGKPQPQPKIFNELNSMARVAGHPVLILSVSRPIASCAGMLKDKIENTGICEDQSCFYTYH